MGGGCSRGSASIQPNRGDQEFSVGSAQRQDLAADEESNPSFVGGLVQQPVSNWPVVPATLWARYFYNLLYFRALGPLLS